MRMAVLAMVLVAFTVDAAPKKKPAAKVGKGFWKVLVTPKAKWVLHRGDEPDHSSSMTVETYDVRKVGTADVARLRWTYRAKDFTRDMSGEQGTFAQVAVTDAGLYLLEKDDDDAKIAKALAGKPSRSDPPKAYEGTKRNHGRYLKIEDGVVCMGTGPEPGAGDCPDDCDGAVCMTTAGIVQLYGTYSPDEFIYDAD